MAPELLKSKTSIDIDIDIDNNNNKKSDWHLDKIWRAHWAISHRQTGFGIILIHHSYHSPRAPARARGEGSQQQVVALVQPTYNKHIATVSKLEIGVVVDASVAGGDLTVYMYGVQYIIYIYKITRG